MKLKVYGCRGSVPSSWGTVSKYGGNTSCISLEASGHTVILDAGSGLVQFDRLAMPGKEADKTPLDILLSHLHLDHLIGLAVFSPIWSSGEAVRIHTCLRGEGTLREQIFGPFVPPYWPSSMLEAANAECIAIKDGISFNLGPIIVTPFIAMHPDDTLSYHLTDGKKTVVHLLDSEVSVLNDREYDGLVQYCKEADLVIFDAAYSPADYSNKKGWGHSTIEDGFKLAEACKCKQMMFSHFSFEYSDQELEILESHARNYSEKFFFARDGMEFDLA